MKIRFARIFLSMLALAPALALACREGPGPGKGDPAPLGQQGTRKAKFNHGREQAQVQLDLLDRPLAKIAELCNENQLTVVSGYRSPSYNARIGGAKGSQHKCGQAADMSFCKGKSLADMFKILARAGCGGIGCYPTFVQCDIGPKRQWGPCPGQRPPPDDPQDERRQAENNKDKPPANYDSKTPDEPVSPAAQQPPPQEAPAPQQASPASSPSPAATTPSPAASYPTPLADVGARGPGFGDQRGPASPRRPRLVAEPPREPAHPGIKDPSTITRPGDRVDLDGTRAFSGSARPASATAAAGVFSSSGTSGLPPAVGKAGAGASAGAVAGANAGDPPPLPPRGIRALGGASGSRSAADAVNSYGTTGSLGSGTVSMGGSTHDFDAQIRNIQEKEFGAALREPASAESANAAADESSLFSRCHAAHLRCVRGGCVTSSGAKR